MNLELTIYTVTDNKGNVIYQSIDKDTAYQKMVMTAYDNFRNETSYMVQNNGDFVTAIDANGEMVSEYYLSVNELTIKNK